MDGSAKITKIESRNFQSTSMPFLNPLLTESGLDDIDDGLAGVDVGDDLSLSGRVLSSLLEDDDLWGLNSAKSICKSAFKSSL